MSSEEVKQSAAKVIGTNLIGTIIGLGIIGAVSIFAWNQGFITNIGLIVGAGIIVASNASLATSNTRAFNKYKINSAILDWIVGPSKIVKN